MTSRGGATPVRPPPARLAPARVWFEYAGPGALSIIGPLTGVTYNFNAGARVAVHGADAARLAGIRGLRPSL